MDNTGNPFSDHQWEAMTRQLSNAVRHNMSLPIPDDPIRDKLIELLTLCLDRGNIATGYAYLCAATIMCYDADPEKSLFILSRLATEASGPMLDPQRN